MSGIAKMFKYHYVLFYFSEAEIVMKVRWYTFDTFDTHFVYKIPYLENMPFLTCC